jgi:very-short-patch-repair endonuclease
MPRPTPLPQPFSDEPFTVASAAAAGISAGRLRARDLHRPFHGVRVAAGVDTAAALRFGSFASARDAEEFASHFARCLEYVPLLRPGQFFSHETAARLWRFPLPDGFEGERPLHVSVVAPGRAPRSVGIVGHRSTVGPSTMRFGLPVSDAVTTWLALAPLLDIDDLVAIADHIVLEPAVLDPYDLRPHAALAELLRRVELFRGRGARKAASAAQQVRPGAESRPETLLRLLMMRAGLPEPEVNVEIRDAAGRLLGRGDLVYREWRVIVEYDGEGHRTSSRQYERDETRLEDFARAGYRVVRIRRGTLFGRPDIAAARIERALRDAGWPG